MVRSTWRAQAALWRLCGLLVLASAAVGCWTTYAPEYDIDSRVTQVAEGASVGFAWTLSDLGAQVEITNTGEMPVRVIWRDTVFGDDSRAGIPLVVLSRFLDGEDQTTSEIPAGATSRFYLFPKGHLRQGDSRHWTIARCLWSPEVTHVRRSPAEAIAAAQSATGKTISFSVPVEDSAGHRQTYGFHFTVREVRARQVNRWL